MKFINDYNAAGGGSFNFGGYIGTLIIAVICLGFSIVYLLSATGLRNKLSPIGGPKKVRTRRKK